MPSDGREEIWVESPSIGYEWSEMHFYRKVDTATGNVAIAVSTDSGCSCNSYEEPDTLQWNWTAEAFYADVEGDLKNFGHWWDAAELAELRSKIRQLWADRKETKPC